MKKTMMLLMLALVLCVYTAALADNSYDSGDYMSEYPPQPSAIVITQKATLRSKPSYQGKNLASVPQETYLLRLSDAENGWVHVEYEGKQGYIREEYLILDQITLTIRKSNTPAYCVPSRSGKQVGSLSKGTMLYVLGRWEDYYVVRLREGSAFIHEDDGVWTSNEANRMLRTVRQENGGFEKYAGVSTAIRYGADESWPEVCKVHAGEKLSVGTYMEDEWVFVLNEDGDFGFVRMDELK